MRPGRRWSFLPLLPLLAGCGATAEAPAAASGAGEDGARGRALFASWNCDACHGESRQGTPFGPPLRGLRAHWDEGTLAAFLADPEAERRRDGRLAASVARFPAPMPPFPRPEAERRAIAAWLLGAPDPH
jgi:mono/diheme cytochrome c family protein